MSKLRELVKGDRVRIVGPWLSGSKGDDEGHRHIGKKAIVTSPKSGPSYLMPIEIEIDGLGYTLQWCRETLRALPRNGPQSPDTALSEPETG